MPSIASELRALRSGRLWLLVLATAAVTGGVMAAFSYISPLLTQRTGLPAWAVPMVLIGFGIGSLAGTNLGGRLGDRNPIRTFLGAAITATLVLSLLVPLSTNAAAAILLVVVLGAAGMSVPSVATSLSMRFAGSAPTLTAAIAVSAFNLGIALGSWIAGHALESQLGQVGPTSLEPLWLHWAWSPSPSWHSSGPTVRTALQGPPAAAPPWWMPAPDPHLQGHRTKMRTGQCTIELTLRPAPSYPL